MQAALLSLVVAGSTIWLALDASKREWTDNSFARNVPSWVIGAVLLWPIVFPLYVFAARKKAPLRNAPAPKPAVAMAAAEPTEQYGPSVEDVEPEPVVETVREHEPKPEPVVEIASEPSFEQPEPVVDVAPPVVAMEPQPLAAPQALIEAEPTFEPEPVAEVQHESVIEVVPVEPEPVAEVAIEPVVEVAPADPQPVSEPVAEVAPEPAVETESEPVLEISFPDMPTEDAPPGLSLDAFKEIKPVAFGGVTVAETEPAGPPEPQSEPVVAPDPGVEPEPELPVAAPVAEPTVADEPRPKKRGFRLPNPELKLPSFGKKKATATSATSADKPQVKANGGLKLPQITLPPNLQGALNDLERKIVLGSMVAIVAAGAFGYATAPTEDAAAPAPTPAPATPTP